MPKNRRPSPEEQLKGLEHLSASELTALLARPEELKHFAARRAAEDEKYTCCVLLSDEEAEWGVKESDIEPEPYINGYDDYSNDMSVDYPFIWLQRRGVTLEQIPLIGNCRNSWRHVHDWSLMNDEATEKSVVLLAAVVVTGSTKKSIAEMELLRMTLRTHCRLPPNDTSIFGSAAQVACLIHSCRKELGLMVPQNHLYVATDTLTADGQRIVVGNYDERAGLDCKLWDERAADDVGFFMLDVFNIK